MPDISTGMGLALRFVAFTPVANVTGRPALALPAGFDTAGLPLSVQLVGRHSDEATLLSLGAELETDPWTFAGGDRMTATILPEEQC